MKKEATRKIRTVKKLLLLASAVCMVSVSVFLGGCGSSQTKSTSSSKGGAGDAPLKVAILAPLTGVSSSWGQRTSNGFKFAAEQFNAAGGVKSMNGRKIEAMVVDTESKPEVASAQAEKLVQDKNVLVLSGSNQSAATVVATQVCERAKVPFVTGSDSDPLITSRNFKYTFRITTLMPDYSRDLLNFMKEMGDKTGKKPKTMAALSVNSILGKTANEAAVKYAKEIGWEVVDSSLYDPTTTKDFTGYISKYKNAKVDILVSHANTEDAILITRTMKELDYNPMAFGGIYGAYPSVDYWDPLGKTANYVLATAPFSFSLNIPGLQDLGIKYQEKYGQKFDEINILGVNAFSVIAQAIEKAGAADREKIREALAGIEMNMGQNNLFQVDGVKFAPNGDNARAKAVVMEIKDGQAKAVYPKQYATTETVWPRPNWKDIK